MNVCHVDEYIDGCLVLPRYPLYLRTLGPPSQPEEYSTRQYIDPKARGLKEVSSHFALEVWRAMIADRHVTVNTCHYTNGPPRTLLNELDAEEDAMSCCGSGALMQAECRPFV